jgi:hypothetical protein
MFDEQPDGDPHGECAAEIHRLQKEVDDLAALLRQLVHALRNAPAVNDLAARAADYLKRKGLQGSPLRADGVAVVDEALALARRFLEGYAAGQKWEREYAAAAGVVPPEAPSCWACNDTGTVTTSSNGGGLIEAPCANCADGVAPIDGGQKK